MWKFSTHFSEHFVEKATSNICIAASICCENMLTYHKILNALNTLNVHVFIVKTFSAYFLQKLSYKLMYNVEIWDLAFEQITGLQSFWLNTQHIVIVEDFRLEIC